MAKKDGACEPLRVVTHRSMIFALCIVASACGAAPPEPARPAPVEAAPAEAPAEAPAPEPAAPEPEPEEAPAPPVVRGEYFGSPTPLEITLAPRPRSPQLVGVLIWKIVMNRRGNGPEVLLQLRRAASGELELVTMPWTEYEYLPIAREQIWALPVAFQEGMRLRATPVVGGGPKVLLLDVLAPGAAEGAEPLATFTLRLPERAQELVLSRGHPEGGYVPDSAVLPERPAE